MKKLLVLEINEVPYKVIDRFVRSGDFPNIKWFFDQAWQFESITVDQGELSPWVTWPTIHRGMSAEKHNIYNLGQDVSTFKGVPIWEEVLKHSQSIGVMGAMQSWPPIDPGNRGFYIPDTFAQDESCIPKDLAKIQRFNLNMVRKNPRVVNKRLAGLNETLGFLGVALKYGLSFRTIFRILKQVIGEKLNPELRARRPIFQTIIFWDIFKCLYSKRSTELKYASFFTNHIAGVMHRYWKDFFPEDFNKKEIGVHNDTMVFALSVLEDIMAYSRELIESDKSTTIIFATSMGQGPIKRDNHCGYELTLNGIGELISALGKSHIVFRPLLAMVPQVAISLENELLIVELKAALEELQFASGKKVFSVQRIGDSLSITIVTPQLSDIEKSFVIYKGQEISFMDAGIVANLVEPGTGYHVPEGIFAVVSQSLMHINQPESIVRARFFADRAKELMNDLLFDDKRSNELIIKDFFQS